MGQDVADRFMNRAPPGNLQTETDEIPAERIKELCFYHDEHYADQCGICYEEFKDGETGVYMLPCHPEHIFHGVCIKDWFKKQAVCPLCRCKMDPTRGNYDDLPEDKKFRPHVRAES